MTTEQKFNCIFCKDVFDNKEELQVHFRKHADPKFKSKNRFELESIESNENVKEKAEKVSCDVCSQLFPTISKAITHKHKVHPDHDVKYFCPWCGKLFTMKHPYNVHIQTSHEMQKHADDKTFHCDSCDVEFFLPSAMTYHNKFFHRQDADVTDIGSSKKLRLYNQEVIQIYYCAFCGEEYENKVNLTKHTMDDHSDENQCPVEVLRCPLCEAIFYHLDAYEIHLGFHSSDDLYSANNELFANLMDFSLETVPPVIEAVDNREEFDMEAHSQDTEADTTANTIGIEKFLELAMGNTDGDGKPAKVKKKKHKKSKKSAAITLNEFLSMNQDVFGEGLDFQGVEEVPTRVVTKQFKNKKNINTVASAELEKLKEKGIVVMRVGTSKPTKFVQRKIASKQTPNRELKTSSEVLTKLINQSNNQIKIVKKSVVNKSDTGQIQNSTTEEGSVDDKEPDSNKKHESEEGSKLTSTNKVENTSTKLDDSAVDYKLPETKTEDHLSTKIATDITANIPVDKNDDACHNENDTQSKMDKDNCITDTIQNLRQNCNIPVANMSPIVNNDERDVKSTNNINNEEDCEEEHTDHEEPVSKTADNNTVTHTDNLEYNNEHINKIQNSNDKCNTQSSLSPVANSLSTLRHLSHLTVKPINQNKNISTEAKIDKSFETQTDSQPEIDQQPPRPIVTSSNEPIGPAKPKPNVDKDPTLDALKMLSKNITIKSLSTSTKRNIEETKSDDESDTDPIVQKTSNNMKLADINKHITLKKIKVEKDEPTVDHKDVSCNKNITIKKIKIEKDEPANVNNAKVNDIVKKSVKIINKVNTLSTDVKSSNRTADSTQNNCIKATNSNILKHLPNITTKPLFGKKTLQSQDSKQNNMPQKEPEIIEISDIDDSDDDTGKQVEAKEDNTKPTDPLRNLSKHITVKSVSQQSQPLHTVIKREKEEQAEHEDDQNHTFDSDEEVPIKTKMCSQKLSSRNMAFKNALKNLGKNITVKSRTSSPSQSVKSQDHNSQDSNEADINEAASELDLDMGQVKITEIENNEHDEGLDGIDHYDPVHSDNEPIVESPHDSCSDHDEMDETDFESEIKATTLQKSSQSITTNKNTICLNNLRNISKSVTIKSVNSNSSDIQAKPKLTQSQDNLEVTKNQTKLTIKPSTQIVKESVNNSSNSKNLKNKSKHVDHSSNELMNQKVCVNKEVTVKTFQTKTVIQEITTTVTKTIKTVNQTVNKQEARNSSHMNIPVLPQKVLGMRPSTSKNLQGVVIRHRAPVTVKPNNAMVQHRPTGPTPRPPKQVVSMMPSSNITRPKAPRMQNVKTNLPKPSPNKQVMGKPLKIAPSVLTSTVKRPNAGEVSGPFSCFKKPKESLIPVSDIPSFGGSGDPTVQLNATSHTSNYTSASKTVKGNTVVTSTQMKSEVTSMQQYSRLGNAVGTKVKNAQVNHTQLQEKIESSPIKRTTLAAIEKLQKQGLLVKKPRREVDENSDSEHIDDNIGYSSTDEHDA